MGSTETQLLGLLTIEQCAEFLQCSVSQVERFIKAGELRRVVLSMREVGKGQRGPKGWRIAPDSLREFIKARNDFEPQVREPKAPSPALSRTPRVPLETGTDGKSRLYPNRK